MGASTAATHTGAAAPTPAPGHTHSHAPSSWGAGHAHPYVHPNTHTYAGARRFGPAIGLAGVCVVAALSPAGDDEGPVLCPYRFLTGGWCPGCGGTRALRSVVRGDISQALTLNPWAVLVLIQVSVLAAMIAAAPATAHRLWSENKNVVLGANAAVAVVAWIIRMGAGTIPTPF